MSVPVINESAASKLEDYSKKVTQRGVKVLKQCDLNQVRTEGSYFAPRMLEVNNARELTSEEFGPILHVVRYKRENLHSEVLAAIREAGYGLTLGVHTRIESVWQEIVAEAAVGNIYINRNMIGAVVGVQPFGGEGLSGTGPKAGGPHYLFRFATERTLTVNTVATGSALGCCRWDPDPCDPRRQLTQSCRHHISRSCRCTCSCVRHAQRASPAPKLSADSHIAWRWRCTRLNEIRGRAPREADTQQDGSYIKALREDHGTHLVDQVSPDNSRAPRARPEECDDATGRQDERPSAGDESVRHSSRWRVGSSRAPLPLYWAARLAQLLADLRPSARAGSFCLNVRAVTHDVHDETRVNRRRES